MTTRDQTKRHLIRELRVMNARDAEAVADILTEFARYYSPTDEQIPGAQPDSVLYCVREIRARLETSRKVAAARREAHAKSWNPPGIPYPPAQDGSTLLVWSTLGIFGLRISPPDAYRCYDGDWGQYIGRDTERNEEVWEYPADGHPWLLIPDPEQGEHSPGDGDDSTGGGS